MHAALLLELRVRARPDYTSLCGVRERARAGIIALSPRQYNIIYIYIYYFSLYILLLLLLSAN